MTSKKDIAVYVEKIVAYIQEETNKREWIPLTYRQVATLVDMSSGSSVVKRIFEELKTHSLLEHRLSKDPSKSKQSICFRVKAKKEEEIFHKLLEAYEKEKAANKALQNEMRKLSHRYERSIAFKDSFMHSLQEQLEIFMWRIQKIASEDSTVPVSTKNTNIYRAKLSRSYIQAGQDLYDQILQQTALYA